MKILIVDDDEALATIFATAFKKNGFEILTASAGKTGLDRARGEKPDLILLDQVLPDTSGNEILKELKLDDKTKNIPIMMLSNFSQEELVKEAISQGAIDYVFKYQIEPQDLVNKIKETLKKNESENQ